MHRQPAYAEISAYRVPPVTLASCAVATSCVCRPLAYTPAFSLAGATSAEKREDWPEGAWSGMAAGAAAASARGPDGVAATCGRAGAGVTVAAAAAKKQMRAEYQPMLLESDAEIGNVRL